MYTKALRTLLTFGLGLVFFVSLIIADGSLGGLIPNMFFPFITGKNFAFRLLVEFLFGLYIILALREPKYRPTGSLFLWATGAFVLWMGLATVFSVDPTKSFWSNFERMDGYITLLHLFVYFVMLSTVVAVEKRWDRFFQTVIIAEVVQAIYGLFQLFHLFGFGASQQSGVRLDGTFGNATYLAVFMLFGVFSTVFMMVRQRASSTALTLYGIALFLQGVVLFFTQTRGAILGLIGGCIIAAIYIAWRARDKRWRVFRKVSLWSVGALVALSALIFMLQSTPLVQNSTTLRRLTSISFTDPTTISRFYIWSMAWHGFTDTPKTMALGWGQENFSYVFNKYYLPQMYNQEQWFDRAHNQFLDWLIAGGLPAFALYISLFALMAAAIIRSELEVPEQAVLLGLLAAYAFNNLFVFDDLMSSVWFFTLIAFAHSISSKGVPRFMALTRPIGDRGIAVAAPVVAVAIVMGMWVLNVPGIARAQNLLTAMQTLVPVPNGTGGITGAPKDPKQNLADFKVALGPNVWPGSPLGQQEATEQLLQFSSAQARQQNIDPAVVKDTHDFAESAGVAINNTRSRDARLELFMGAFYDTFGEYSKALQWLQQARADSPQKQQILLQLGLSQMNSNNVQDALKTFKTAFEEEEKNADARLLYVAGLFYAGNTNDADQLLLSGPKDQGFGTVLVDDQRLVQVYMRVKFYDRALAILKARITAEPGNTQNYFSLASAYFTMGDNANTIATLQAVAQQDPTLASQTQSLIQQIQNGTLKP